MKGILEIIDTNNLIIRDFDLNKISREWNFSEKGPFKIGFTEKNSVNYAPTLPTRDNNEALLVLEYHIDGEFQLVYNIERIDKARSFDLYRRNKEDDERALLEDPNKFSIMGGRKLDLHNYDYMIKYSMEDPLLIRVLPSEAILAGFCQVYEDFF